SERRLPSSQANLPPVYAPRVPSASSTPGSAACINSLQDRASQYHVPSSVETASRSELFAMSFLGPMEGAEEEPEIRPSTARNTRIRRRNAVTGSGNRKTDRRLPL